MSSHKKPERLVHFLVPYPPGLVAGQRFRFEQYLSILKEKGYQVFIHPFLDLPAYTKHNSKTRLLTGFLSYIRAYYKRLMLLPDIRKSDFVFVYREVTLAGPAVIEWIIACLFKKKIIYDFDDAIWLTDNKNESFAMRAFRYRSKVKKICTISYKVSCGNEYLGAFARKYNRHVVINPTTIELSLHNYQSHKKIPQGAKVVIGWTGTQSTLKYLELIGPQLRALEEALPQVNFLVVADKMPTMKLNRLEYRAWSIETEIADLAEMDIGIMPLPDDEWTRGKCGFKALQYMAMRVPAVVSNVGVNSQIITDGKEGFVISTPDEWIEKLRKLVLDPELRTKMGIAAYEKVRNGYSTESNARNFLSLFE